MRLVAIKVGGGLLGQPGALDRACAAIAAARAEAPLVVLPGGGPFADAVRAFDATHGLGDAAAHWMAILGMDQYAHALADRLPDAALVTTPAEVPVSLAAGELPVMAPFRWLRAADPFPAGWDVTSDSLAAWMAGALGAERLILVKPVADAGVPLVDPMFEAARPRDLGVRYVAAADVAQLPALVRP